MTFGEGTKRKSRALMRAAGVACWVGVGLFSEGAHAEPREGATDAQPLSGRPEVTYSGFQRNPGGDGVVFVHVTEKTGIAVRHEGTHVKVRLHGAFIKGRNNLYPLDLSQFNLLILSSRLVLVDGEVELQLELRREAHLDTRWVERPDGAVSLHVVVPKL